MKLIYSVHKYDVALFIRLINANLYPQLARSAHCISRTGDGHLYGLLVAILYFSEGSNSPFLQTLMWAFLIERPMYFAMKNVFKRNRPHAALKGFNCLVTASDQFSFPSGHTYVAFMVAIISGFLMPVLLLPLLLWVVMVGFHEYCWGFIFPLIR